MKAGEIKIVEYHQKYGTNDEIRSIAFRNFLEQQNSTTFNGLYMFMKSKYGNTVYIIFALPIVLLFTCAFFLLSKLGLASGGFAIIPSLSFSIIGAYLLFGVYLVQRITKINENHGKQMLLKDFDINEKYNKKGGAFWLAVWHNPNTKNHQIIGHFGILPRPDYSDGKSEKTLKALRMELFGVCEHARGAGVGKLLVEQAIDYAKAKKVGCITLGVLQVNTRAINLYKKYGFKVTRGYQIDSLTGFAVYEMVKIFD